MALDEALQLFVQCCMSRRSMSEKTAMLMYKRCAAAVGEHDAQQFATALDEINAALELFGFAIKRFSDEHSGKPWIAFVNIKDDEIAKLATEYAPQEIAYFRIVVKQIMRSGKAYAINSIPARNAGNKVNPKLSPTAAEAALASFVANGWLVLVNVQRGRKQEEMYQLSSRTRMELEHYLTEEFPRQTDKDYECKICNELVMKGLECLTANCKTRMHDHCSRAYVARANAVCPKCKSPWNVDDLEKIGPQATDTAYDGGSSDESDPEPPTPAPRTRRSQQRNRSDDEQPSEEEQEDGPATPGPSNSRERVRRGGSNVSRQAALDGSSGRRIRREDTLMESDQEDKPEADDLDEEVDELEEDEPPPPSTTSGRKKGRGR